MYSLKNTFFLGNLFYNFTIISYLITSSFHVFNTNPEPQRHLKSRDQTD